MLPASGFKQPFFFWVRHTTGELVDECVSSAGWCVLGRTADMDFPSLTSDSKDEDRAVSTGGVGPRPTGYWRNASRTTKMRHPTGLHRHKIKKKLLRNLNNTLLFRRIPGPFCGLKAHKLGLCFIFKLPDLIRMRNKLCTSIVFLTNRKRYSQFNVTEEKKLDL